MSNRTEPLDSFTPDALDRALNLGGVFDGDLGASDDDWQSASELTARPNEHVPPPSTVDDEEAPAPEDLGRAWLEQATESERSLGYADTIPDVERLPNRSDASSDADDSTSEDQDSNEDEDDETSRRYVRQHRVSSSG